MRAFAIITAAVCTVALAQQFEPYSERRITEAQWRAYFDEVQSLHGATMLVPRDQHTVIFEASDTSYVFTQPGHKAHPAWTARRHLRRGNEVKIERIAFFAGDGRAFGNWYLTHLALDERHKRWVREKNAGK